MLRAAPHALAGQKVALTAFDRIAVDMFVPTIFAYPAPTPSNQALRDGLLKAVAAYPHLAGRFAVDDRGRRHIHLNNEGVLLVEATSAENLADVLADDGRVNGGDMYPTVPEVHIGAALLQIQLNRYSCGGLVIGMTTHHHAADGHAMSTFLTVWASAVREAEGFVAPSPFLDRAATVVPRPRPLPRSSTPVAAQGDQQAAHAEPKVVPAERIKNLTLNFTADQVVQLKARVDGSCSTFLCLLAHVWKSITAARGLSPERFTAVRVGVNCRGRANPPFPADFFGNMVLWAVPRLQARDVLGWSYGQVVGAIQDAVARINDEYIQSFVDRQEQDTSAAGAGGAVLSSDIEGESWLGFRFHQIDFGNGPPAAFLPPDLPYDGLMVFMPSCKAKGDVHIFTAVAEEHAAAFRHLCYSLD